MKTNPIFSIPLKAMVATSATVALLLGGGALHAQTVPPASVTPVSPTISIAPIAWQRLNATQQARLAPLQDLWSQLPAISQQKWVDVIAFFDQISPEEQTKATARMREWALLRGQQREGIRRNFEQANREATPEQRLQLWQMYQTLEPVHKKSLLSQPLSPRDLRTPQ